MTFNPGRKDLLNPNLKDFWQTPAPIKVLYGGRDSTKTYDTAGFFIFLSTQFRLKFMCTRQFQNRIEDSVYSVLKTRIEEFGLLNQFIITNNRIIHKETGSTFIFMGLWRNITEIKGTDGIDILWIEEAENLLEEQWKVIYPTIRKEGAMILLLFNPDLVTDFVWQRFVLNPIEGTLIRKINFNENPFLSETSRDKIRKAYEEDYEEADHIYGGNPKQDDDEAIIKRKWIMACIDAHIKLERDITGGRRIGFDVADDGEDLCATATVNGGLLQAIDTWKAGEDELYDSTVKVYDKAIEIDADVAYDSNGLGAGVGSNIKQINKLKGYEVKYNGFNSAETPANPDSLYRIDGIETEQTNRDYFENRKAQAWWLLADRIKATYRAIMFGDPIGDQLISFSSNIDNIEAMITELSSVRKKKSGRLKNMAEKKDDLAKRGIKSPNIADAVVMAYYPHYSEGKVESFKVNI